RGKLHTLLEERQRFFQGHFTLFQFLDNLFQALETIFKFGQVEKPLSYCIPFLPSEYRVKTVWLRRQWSSCDPPPASREACGNPAAALRLRAGLTAEGTTRIPKELH